MSDTQQEVVDLEVQLAHHSRARFTVIDVRQPYEMPSGVIDNAFNLPLDKVLTDGLPGVPTRARILVVCRSGIRSMEAARALSARGYTAVHNLRGGMVAWLEDGLPVGRSTIALRVPL